MKTTDLIIKHLNALISKYQLEMDLLSEMKKKPINELHQAEIDINIAYFEEEIKEIKEILKVLERDSKRDTLTFLPTVMGKPIIKSASEKELIKDAEILLKEFKQSDDIAKNELAIKVRNDFFDKFYDYFPDFCFFLGRTLDSYYTIEVSEKYLEFLKELSYKEAEKKILIWCDENLYKL